MLLTFSLSSNHAFGQLDSFHNSFLISLSYTLCGLPQNTQFNYEKPFSLFLYIISQGTLPQTAVHNLTGLLCK